ncbi:MAG: hypothetical protein IT424_05920 [Pirellulales bacterium]|nr:hypothetical protein [Pirellulales bacterium]
MMHTIHCQNRLIACAALSLFAALGCFAGRSCAAAAPLLVLTDDASANPFGAYYSEILRGEGLLEFDVLDRAAWNSDGGALLPSDYRAVILPEMSLTAPEEQRLRSYVQAGGVLLGARPDSGPSDVFGIEWAGNRPERTLQYYGVDPQGSAGRGITPGALQYHGVAANYELRGASGLAYLYANATTPSANPAITTHRYGEGRAIAFTFDPAKSVVLTRQGNPNWQNTEGDGIPGYRPHDMFTRTDGRSYYDPARLAIPQADELQRLLANVLQEAVEAPLPRMWYLPGAHKAVMVNTGDGEDNYGSQLDGVLDDAASYGGKFSVYLGDFGVANTSVAQEAAWRAAGHEVGVHMFADGAEGAGAESYMDYAYDRVTGSLEAKYGHGARTARNHTIDWTGWVEMARIEAAHGTLLDTNYYHYLNGGTVDPLSANGYFTGSGLPQQLIDEDGALLGIYQAATQWPDEWFADRGFSAQQAVDAMEGMFEAAEQRGYYSAFVNNIHPVRYEGSDITSQWAHAIWQYCQDEGIPMWSAEMLLDFVQARSATQFNGVAYEGNSVAFDYVAGADRPDLTVMLPLTWGERRLLDITLDGQPVEWTSETIKGRQYALLTPSTSIARVVADYALPLATDFDGDNDVDADDLAVWQTAYAVDAAADANLDGQTDGADFLQWQRQFPKTPAAIPAQPIPEPRLMKMLVPLAMVVPLARSARRYARPAEAAPV